MVEHYVRFHRAVYLAEVGVKDGARNLLMYSCGRLSYEGLDGLVSVQVAFHLSFLEHRLSKDFSSVSCVYEFKD